MKNYKRVVKERYDRQKYSGKAIVNDMYSLINPIGFYGEFKSAQILKDFVNMLIADGKNLDEIRICDCGCGDGVKTRFLSELLENPDHVYGTEYSKNRLEHCEKMNTLIHYQYADLAAPDGIPFDVQFDGITAFVVFMHFISEEEIMCALHNINRSLKKGGVFLWYELRAHNHREGRRKNTDHWGFSAGEMDGYAAKAGFRLLKESFVYRQIPMANIATVYLAKDIKNIWILELLEKLPLRKNNLVRIYRKE